MNVMYSTDKPHSHSSQEQNSLCDRCLCLAADRWNPPDASLNPKLLLRSCSGALCMSCGDHTSYQTPDAVPAAITFKTQMTWRNPMDRLHIVCYTAGNIIFNSQRGKINCYTKMWSVAIFQLSNRVSESVYRVEQRDAEVLDDAVQSHELEDAEWCDEGSSALPSERKDALCYISHM